MVGPAPMIIGGPEHGVPLSLFATLVITIFHHLPSSSSTFDFIYYFIIQTIGLSFRIRFTYFT